MAPIWAQPYGQLNLKQINITPKRKTIWLFPLCYNQTLSLFYSVTPFYPFWKRNYTKKTKLRRTLLKKKDKDQYISRTTYKIVPTFSLLESYLFLWKTRFLINLFEQDRQYSSRTPCKFFFSICKLVSTIASQSLTSRVSFSGLMISCPLDLFFPP